MALTALFPEGAALCQASLAPGRLAQQRRAAAADDDGLAVAENRGAAISNAQQQRSLFPKVVR